jgi:hypothetical protein
LDEPRKHHGATKIKAAKISAAIPAESTPKKTANSLSLILRVAFGERTVCAWNQEGMIPGTDLGIASVRRKTGNVP